ELVAAHCSDEVASDEWDLKTLDDAAFAQFNLRLNLPELAAGMTRSAEVEELVVERVRQAYTERETAFTPPVMRHLERIIWLQTLDTLWRDHLLSMDHLKEGIGLRGYGQKNPLQEYQKEGYDLFEELLRRMEADVVEKLMSVQLQAQPAAAQAQPAAQPGFASGDFEPPMPAAVADMQRRQQERAANRVRLSHGGAPTGPQKGETVRRDAEKVGRTAPCPGGAGKKSKKCPGVAGSRRLRAAAPRFPGSPGRAREARPPRAPRARPGLPVRGRSRRAQGPRSGRRPDRARPARGGG